MADKKINIVFNAVGDAAARNMKEVSAGIDQVQKTALRTTPTIKDNNFQLMNMSRIVQDLPFGFMGIGNNITFMAEQMTRAKAEGQSFSTQLKGMASSMMGTGGLMFAISAVTSLITYFAMQSRGAEKEISEFTLASVTATESTKAWADSIKKVTKELAEITPTELISMISLMNKNLADLDVTAGKLLAKMTFVDNRYGILGQLFFGSDLDDTIKKIIQAQASLNVATGLQKSGQGLIPQLEGKIAYNESIRKTLTDKTEVLKYSQWINSDQEKLNELLGKEHGSHKKIRQEVIELNKELEERLKLEIKFAEQLGQSLLPHKQSAGLGSEMSSRGLPNRNLGFLGISDQEMKRQFAEFNVIAQSAADTMRQAFSQAWQDIFGEANSLLEMFLQNIASGLLSLAAESVSSSIFSYLTGGAGLLLKPSTGGDNIINLKIGDDTVEKFVFKGLPGAMNRGIRTRAF